MIVVAIIGILSAVAIPEFANLVGKSQEGATKVNLGTIRSALAIYYGDNDGFYPSNLTALIPNYLVSLPAATVPPHN